MNDNLISLKDVRVQDLHGTKIESLDWQMQLEKHGLLLDQMAAERRIFYRLLPAKNSL